jgi:hypothetical protein
VPAPQRVKVLFKPSSENKRIHHEDTKNTKLTKAGGAAFPSAASLFFVFFLPLW